MRYKNTDARHYSLFSNYILFIPTYAQISLRERCSPKPPACVCPSLCETEFCTHLEQEARLWLSVL